MNRRLVLAAVAGLILAAVLVLRMVATTSGAPAAEVSQAPVPAEPEPVPTAPPEPEVPAVPFPDEVDPKFSPERAQVVADRMAAMLGVPTSVDCSEWPCLILLGVRDFGPGYAGEVAWRYSRASDETPGHMVARTSMKSRCMIYGAALGGTKDDHARMQVRIDAYGETVTCAERPAIAGPEEPPQ